MPKTAAIALTLRVRASSSADGIERSSLLATVGEDQGDHRPGRGKADAASFSRTASASGIAALASALGAIDPPQAGRFQERGDVEQPARPRQLSPGQALLGQLGVRSSSIDSQPARGPVRAIRRGGAFRGAALSRRARRATPRATRPSPRSSLDEQQRRRRARRRSPPCATASSLGGAELAAASRCRPHRPMRISSAGRARA